MAQKLEGMTFTPTTKHTPLKLYTDAGFDPSTNLAGAGIFITDHTGVPVATKREALGKTDNVRDAENKAMCRGIKYLADTPINHVHVYGDNRWVVKNGDWDQLTQHFIDFSVTDIPRSDNIIADELATLALEHTV